MRSAYSYLHEHPVLVSAYFYLKHPTYVNLSAYLPICMSILYLAQPTSTWTLLKICYFILPLFSSYKFA